MDDHAFQLVCDCFIYDDGSLPGIELTGLTRQDVAAIYAFIRRGSRLSNDAAEFWNKREERPISLDAVANAAELVANGEADSFHFCFTGLRVGGVELPELGLFVFEDNVELDYRMGRHWTRSTITAFFKMLRELCDLAPQAKVAIPSAEPPPESDRFLEAWSRYCQTVC